VVIVFASAQFVKRKLTTSVWKVKVASPTFVGIMNLIRRFIVITQSWWGNSIVCPKCGVQGSLTDFQFSADGEIRLGYKCPKCDAEFYWKVFASALQEIARGNDLQKHCKNCIKGIVTTPLALPKPPDDFETFMKGLGA
jgi:DNA-directed RNA polymerase subunit RPC12/RpoP